MRRVLEFIAFLFCAQFVTFGNIRKFLSSNKDDFFSSSFDVVI